MHTASQFQIDSPAPAPVEARYEALVRVSQAIGAHRHAGELFRSLSAELSRIVSFDYICVILYDEARDEMCWQVLDLAGQELSSPPPDLKSTDAPSGWVYRHQEPLVIPFLAAETRFPRITGFLKSWGVESTATFPLTTIHRRLGTLGFGSEKPNAYSDDEVAFLSLVADQVALAIDDALNFEASQEAGNALQREKDRLKLLLDLNNTIVSNLELGELLRALSASVRGVLECDGVGVLLLEPDGKQLRLHALDFPESKGFIREQILIGLDEQAPPAIAFRTGKALALDSRELDALDFSDRIPQAEGAKCVCMAPLASRNGILGVLGLARLQEKPFTQDEIDFACQVAGQVAIAVENALAYQQIAELKDQLALEKLYLEDEIRTELNFDEIVGRSAALRRVLQQVETVAPTDATVLVSGETGCGKELIARAIHNLSPRRQSAFVKLNCAAIPAGLLESELFGHERGAFTGAVSQRIGRFELGNHGTVFLDEIGEAPLELQPKLLRVLQEREFERLGSSRTLRTDARLIAATNCDLAAMVDEGKFRMDLFYRLNIFPIEVPPLRTRQEDIPLLVRHFVHQFARRMNRTIDTVPSETMHALVHYHWPGNIRELQNLIERAVILSAGPVLKVPLAHLKMRATAGGTNRRDTLEEAERKHVLAVLEDVNWVLSGPNGAAERLGLKRSTLQFRMRKMGISRPGK